MLKRKIVIVLIVLVNNLQAQEWYNNIYADSIWNTGGANACIYDMQPVGDSLFFGGVFNRVNSLGVNRISKLYEGTWSAYGNGITGIGGGVEAVIYYKNKLFIGGGFSEVEYLPETENIAIWYDNSWHACELGEPSSDVYEFCIYHDTLFVGGRFSYIGSEPFQRIAAYDGNNWINVGSISGDYVGALEVYNDELYAGRIYGVVKYLGGTEWEYLFDSPEGYVQVMKTDTFNNFLYAGGAFHYINDTVLSRDVAMFDGFNWNSLEWVINCDINEQAMAVYRGDLYVGGCFDTLVSGLPVNFIAKWDGERWDSVGSGVNLPVKSLEVFQDTLWVGGFFTEAGGLPAYGLAKVFVPDTGCGYIKPKVLTVADTFYLNEGIAEVNFYNNNAYVDSWDWDFGDLGTANIKDPQHTYTAIGDYEVQVTVSHGSCTKSATKTIHVAMGSEVPELENLEFKVYPNPSDKYFIVEFDLTENIVCELRITGLNGHTKTLVKLTENRTTINTDGWKNGTYICNLLINGKLIKSEKIVLSK